METKSSRPKGSNASIRRSLRELTSQLSLLNHQVGHHLEMKDVDLDCLDLIALHGPISPTELSKHAGLHPATVTGVLDRLEANGWAAREADPIDRRAVVVQVKKERTPELLKLYAPMNGSVDKICNDYDEAQLALVAEFLKRITEAGLRATHDLALR